MVPTKLPPDRIPELMEFARIAGSARDIESLRLETLHLIRRAFRSDSTIFWLLDENNRAAKPLDENVQPCFFPMYMDHFFRKNPFDPTNIGSFSGTALSMEQIIPYDEFRKTEYYNDFIKPQGIRRQMVVYIRVDERLTSVICTHRCKDRRFKEEDMAAGDTVSLHLSAAFKRIHLVEEVKKRGSFFKMILDNADIGIAVLDLEKRPVFINKKAVHICEGIRGEILPEHRHYCLDSVIPPPLLKDCDAVEKCLEKDPELSPGSIPMRERTLRVSSFEKCRFRTRIADGILTDFNRPLILITMEILPLHGEIDLSAVKRECNLTKRETEIVSYIYRGYRNAEIADRLFISEGTVKNHLRNIFEKTEVKSRTGLIHKMLSL